MYAYDSNLYYKASQDCRRAYDPDKCLGYKNSSLRAFEAGKVGGCIVPHTVQREVRRYLIEEFTPFCEMQELDARKKRFVEKFVDKLVAVAMKDEKFLATCTSMGQDRFHRIARARRGDWKIVGETLAEGRDVTLVSFDHNIVDDYCVRKYRETAERVAEEMKFELAEWEAKRPELVGNP